MGAYDLRDLGGGTASGLLTARAAYTPQHSAIEAGGRVTTYRELDEAATLVASALLGLGLEQGDAVSVFLTNRSEYLVAVLGIGRAGLVYVPVNVAFKGEFLEHAIGHSDSRAVITEARLAAPIADLPSVPDAVRMVVYIDGVPDRQPVGPAELLSWDQLLAGADATVVFPPVGPSDVVAISYTSGTTGRSKGVLNPALQSLVMAKETATAMGTTSRDRLYVCMPLFHGAALVAGCMHAFYAGATVVLAERFSASRFWDEVRAARVTQFNALGSILPMLLAQPPAPSDTDHEVRIVFAAPAPPEVLFRFESRFGVSVVEGYGSTEIKNVLYSPVVGRKAGSMGLPTASSIVEVHDGDGRPARAGEVGEIVYRPKLPDIMFRGYHRDPEATLATMTDLWWHTGDLGYVDDDGFFYFVDRAKDAIRRRGENISSQEVESTLILVPGVKDAAAVAVRSDIGEDEVLVALEVEDPDAVDLEAVFAHCNATMPHFMVPRYYRLATDLPRTPNGKIQKALLREQGVTTETWDATAAGMLPTRTV